MDLESEFPKKRGEKGKWVNFSPRLEKDRECKRKVSYLLHWISRESASPKKAPHQSERLSKSRAFPNYAALLCSRLDLMRS